MLHQREEPLLHQKEMAGSFYYRNGHDHNQSEINTIHFDLDSFHVGIDNRASGCFSFNRGDFADNLWKINHIIKIKPQNQTLSAPGLDTLVVLGG